MRIRPMIAELKEGYAELKQENDKLRKDIRREQNQNRINNEILRLILNAMIDTDRLPEYLTTGAAAKVLAVNERTVRQYLTDGKLDGKKTNTGTWIATRESVLAFRDHNESA